MYVSKLLSHTGRDPSNTTLQLNNPLVFVLICATPNRWQIGRLVDRLHRIGAARMAALFDLSALNRFSEDIRALHGPVVSEGGAPEDDRLLTALRQEVADIDVAANRANTTVSGGVSYRVERLRYYRKEISDLLQRLHARRLEGFPPYDEFIGRKLYSTFDFIEGIGVRYEKILNRQRLATNRISGILSQMQEALANLNSAKLVRIQKRGEVFAFAFIVPSQIHDPIKDFFYAKFEYPIFLDFRNLQIIGRISVGDLSERVMPWVWAYLVSFVTWRIFEYARQSSEGEFSKSTKSRTPTTTIAALSPTPGATQQKDGG